MTWPASFKTFTRLGDSGGQEQGKVTINMDHVEWVEDTFSGSALKLHMPGGQSLIVKKAEVAPLVDGTPENAFGWGQN